MNLKFIDCEVEKNKVEGLQGYEFRYHLDEINFDGTKKQILRTNSYSEVLETIGRLALYSDNGKIEFVNNVVDYRKLVK